MIQPGTVGRGGTNIRRALIRVPTSMTAYWRAGMFYNGSPGACRIVWPPSGMLAGGGVVYRHTCLAILLAKTIEQFTLLRLLAGHKASVSVGAAMGYATYSGILRRGRLYQDHPR